LSILADYVKNSPGINKIVSILGLDKAIFYTIITVFWSVISGLVSIIFIIKYITITEQGYWYTFQSLGALSSLAELGFTTIVTQFISHEYAHLNIKNSLIVGDNERTGRVISLIRFSFKFYIIVILLAFILLTVVGSFFLMHSTNDAGLILTWIAYSFSGAFLLLVSLLGVILKGFNKVELVQKIIFITSFAGVTALWISLSLGLGLWALVIGSIVNIILSIWLFFSSSRMLWHQIFHFRVTNSYNWLKETLPLQWRYAISWTSGYLILQFMVPVTMYYAGAALAGQLGLSLVIARSVQNMACSWGMTKLPQFNMLVAKKDRKKLDKLLNEVQKRSLLVFILGAAIILLILAFIFPLIGWEQRVLPVYEILIILLAEAALLIVYNWAFYLRSHKKEPYMLLSLINGITMSIGIWVSMYFFASTLIALSIYCIVQWIVMIFAGWIFVKKRAEYSKLMYKKDVLV
jgi:O-antigen/teichoic acid export membrane protein